jgi:YesN/AraC family two-component response regulator
MISLAMSFFVFVVSFLGYIYPQALSGKPLSTIANPFKYKNSGLTESAELVLKDELIKCMEEQELYKYQLSLEELASKLNSNRHSVSLVINKYFDGNYFEFLNRYRVGYVKKLLLDAELAGTPIIQLAYDAGFNNKVSFNKAFKKHTGVTPMTYRATKGKIKSDN